MNSGSQWIKQALKLKEMSPLGEAVANLLDDVFAGIYHLDGQKLKKADWGDDYIVSVQIAYQQLSTVDSSHLTWLVVLSHDRCLRLSIRAATINTLELMFHQRQRDGDFSERIPTIEEQIGRIRKATSHGK